MPPSSRKRNKGKDRKAKQLAKKEENERSRANTFWRALCDSSTGCYHGCASVSDDHPVFCFMNQFFFNLHYNDMKVIENLKDTLEKHPQVWNNENHRNIAINIFICIGSNFLLRNFDVHFNEIYNPLCIAKSILVLEQYNGIDGIYSAMNSRVVISKGRDLDCGTNSIKRDLLKFYRKRTPCKCLKKMHLEARKSTPKMGDCWYCNKETERVLLSLCSRCMIDQYCSRECQVAHWPDHKSECDILVCAHK